MYHEYYKQKRILRYCKSTLYVLASCNQSTNYSKMYNIAVVGATGNVGRVLLSILKEENFPIGDIYAVASNASSGKKVSFGEKEIVVCPLEGFDFSDVDIAFFSAGAAVSKEYAQIAAKHCVVIDNTSYFRTYDDVPLVVPEVNGERIAEYTNRGIIANPNCAVAQLVMVLKPLHDIVPIKRVVITTMQSVSGAGKKAMDELYGQTKGSFMGDKLQHSALPRRIAFNIIPQIGEILEDGGTNEEFKVMQEVKKILGEDIGVTATCVRVPVFIGHSESVNIEFDGGITLEQICDALARIDGVIARFDHETYFMPVDVVGENEVYVSRIRRDHSKENCFNMWVVSDNLRKGAALNAVQIAKELVQKYI